MVLTDGSKIGQRKLQREMQLKRRGKLFAAQPRIFAFQAVTEKAEQESSSTALSQWRYFVLIGLKCTSIARALQSTTGQWKRHGIQRRSSMQVQQCTVLKATPRHATPPGHRAASA
ncbi:hypothetical protein TcWFU_006521 [Taenia crassiceps]|uniref:Uncharacterized protein n=1 Tax=Taenia crassiceps TaxID=6207 RepID=A0ABR4Q316_9CEST